MVIHPIYNANMMVYIIKYEINATTGDILESSRDYDDDYRDDDDDDRVNSSNNSSSGNSNNQSTSNSANTSTVSSTISGYRSNANNILNSINTMSIPSNRSEIVALYNEWEREIESLDNTLDDYDDTLERMYERGELSRSDYNTFENELEAIEDILEQAEEVLENRTGYDD